MTSRKESVLLLSIFILSLSLRVIYLVQIKGNPFFYDLPPGTDMRTYDLIAMEVVGGKWLAGGVKIPSLYPCLFLPTIYFLFGHNLLMVRLIQSILGSLGCILLYFIARRIFSQKAAFLSALMAAFYGIFIIYEGAILSEALLNFLIILTMLSLLRVTEQPSLANKIASGLWLGLAVAIKPSVLVFLPFVLIWFLIIFRRRAMINFLTICLMMLLTAAPFIVRAYLISHEFILVRTGGGAIFLMGNNPSASGTFCYPSPEVTASLVEKGKGESPSEQDRLAYQAAFKFIKENPGKFLRLTIRKFLLFWDSREIPNNISSATAVPTFDLKFHIT